MAAVDVEARPVKYGRKGLELGERQSYALRGLVCEDVVEEPVGMNQKLVVTEGCLSPYGRWNARPKGAVAHPSNAPGSDRIDCRQDWAT